MSTDAKFLISNFTMTERGNVLLVWEESGDFNYWGFLPGGHVLEVAYRQENYPALDVQVCSITTEKLAAHINRKCVGMQIRKCNLDGVHSDGGYIVDLKEK